jgi:hypothetical protein
MAAGDVLAPPAPETPNLRRAAIVVPPLELRVDPAMFPQQAIMPDAEFVAAITSQIVTTQAKGRLAEDTLRAYASIAGWPADVLDQLVVVARCESHNRAFATNGAVRGVMQVHTMWFSYTGLSIEAWDAPITNLQVAYGVYQYDLRRGNPAWAQWECKPDGTVVRASAFLAEPVIGSDVQAAGAAEPAEAGPTATPAPWDQKPVWPAKP